MKQIVTGVDKFFYAILKDESAETYDTVKELPGVIEVGIVPTEQQNSIYAQNQEYATDSALAGVEATFTFAEMSTDDYCAMFGKKLANEGGFIESSDDVKPYIAVMMEKTLTGGAIEYVTLFKGKLNIPEDKVKTKEGQVEFQTKQFSGKFIPLNTKQWKYVVRSTDANFNAETWGTKWGTQVIKPTVKVAGSGQVELKEK